MRLAAVLLAAAARLAAQAPSSPDSLQLPLVRLDSLRVEALRAPLHLARAPLAASVVGAAELRRGRPGLALEEGLRLVPGLQVDNRFNFAQGERISVRGFGARAQFGVRGVKVLLDGIPATLPDGQTQLTHIDPAALERAEVLRGPASALYGNAAGGVLYLQTQAPFEQPLAQRLRFTAGSDGLARLHQRIGGRSGAASYQLQLSRLRYGGFREHASAEQQWAGLRLGYDGTRDHLLLLLDGVDYAAESPGALPDSLLRADRGAAWPRNLAQRTGEDGRQAQLGLRWRRTLPAAELELVGYALRRTLDNPIPTAVIDLARWAGGVRALLRARAASPRAPQWAAGLDADLQRDRRVNYQNRAGERGARTLDQRERVRGLGLFGQLVVPATPRLDVLGGLRYDHVGFRADDRLVGAADPDDSGRRGMGALSPSLGVQYRAGRALQLYANLATAFETPTTTELVNRPEGAGGLNPELQPQRTRSVEVGLRGGRGASLRYELAAYRAEVSDALVPFQVPGSEGRDFFRNAGRARHRGLEASARLGLTPALSASAAYTLTDAVFRRYAVRGEVFDGNRLPGVAPQRATLVLAYAPRADAFAELELRAASRTPVNDANRAHSPGYALLDVRLGHPGIRLWRARLAPFAGAANLLDRAYNASVVVNAFGARYYEPGPGRTWHLGAELTVK